MFCGVCVCVWMCVCLCVCCVCKTKRDSGKTKCVNNALRSRGKANKLGGPYKFDLSNELTNVHI